ncbi:MAG: glycosyltransferase [Candidatus Omnitrophica bacterium]|nr:glycosyltransferase [Candidatus Omnitrophota bacterium]MDD5429313.1 glycosyltransferase [Candidatus Omnitrophota bacterium]
MKVSIVIPTYERHDSLKNLLQDILRQRYDDFEVIIVNQGLSFPKELGEILTANKSKIRLFNDDMQNSAHARNKGIRKAEGEIVISCDDDIRIEQDFIQNHVKEYKNKYIGAVSGRVLCANDIPTSKIKKVGEIRKYDGKVTANFNADFKTEIEHAYGCNVSFRKELLLRVGGYDERLIGTSSFDDADVSFKIRKLGYRIVFEPLAEAVHLQARGGCRDILPGEKVYWYYHNFMLFYLKHMCKIFFPIFFLRQLISIFRRAFIGKSRGIVLKGIRGLKDGFRDYRKKT